MNKQSQSKLLELERRIKHSWIICCGLTNQTNKLFNGSFTKRLDHWHATPANPVPQPHGDHEGGSESKGNKTDKERKLRRDWGPFPRIPNCKALVLGAAIEDELFSEFGLKRNLPRDTEIIPYKNNRLQRYALYNIERLRGTTNSELYWHRAKVLMARSIVFQMMALAKSFPRWHRELPYVTVTKWIHTVQSSLGKPWWKWMLGSGDRIVDMPLMDDFNYEDLNQDELDEIDYWGSVFGIGFKRTFIPKGIDGWRPLGVPTPAARIMLSIMNWMLLLRYNKYIPSWQHGFRPRKGTLTAWKSILKDTIKAKYIYEFDLRGFFDNVPIEKTLAYLQNLGLSAYFTQLLMWYAFIWPQVDPEDKEKLLTLKASDRQRSDLQSLEEGERKGRILKNYACTADLMYSMQPTEVKGPSANDLRFDPDIASHKGWPQGANISPLLSILAIAMLGQPKFAKLLMYADDGIFYSDQPFEEKEVQEFFKPLGVEVAEEKSKWIKAGEWIHPLKFLGLTFNGQTNELRSSTRKGASLKMDKHELIQAEKARQLEGTVEQMIMEDARSWQQDVSVWQYYRVLKGNQPDPNAEPILEGRKPKGGKGFLEYDDQKGKIWGAPLRYKEVADIVQIGEGHYYLSGPNSKRHFEFFTKDDALQARELWDEDLSEEWTRPVSTNRYFRVTKYVSDGGWTRTWTDVAKSKIFGYIQSRMYGDDWNPYVHQSFMLKWVPLSWVGTRGEKYIKLMDFANSTSYAFYDASQHIRKQRKLDQIRKLYEDKQITFAEMNAKRTKLGFQPVKRFWSRKLIDKRGFRTYTY